MDDREKGVKDNLPERKVMGSEIVFYQAEDGKSRIEVRLEDNTVWLTQRLMAELYQTTVANVSIHPKNLQPGLQKSCRTASLAGPRRREARLLAMT